MAMSVTYVTVHGRLREETRGGVTTRYLGDTLGSVIKTTDTSGNVTSTTTYWPFGEVRSQTGTNPSPWGFCGVWGYLTDAVSRKYVRARHYRADMSRWLSVDPLWPRQSAYKYASSSPILMIDFTGLAATKSCPRTPHRHDNALVVPLPFDPGYSCDDWCRLKDAIDKANCARAYGQCMKRFGYIPYFCQARLTICLGSNYGKLLKCAMCCNEHESTGDWDINCFSFELPDPPSSSHRERPKLEVVGAIE
jgi:RHS repeat-associated protein